VICYDYDDESSTAFPLIFEYEDTTTYTIALHLDDNPDLSEWSFRFANQERARAVLRDGIFWKQRVGVQCFPAPAYRRRAGRCDRKGIGLRLRRDR